MSLSARISNIARSSLHDGPGVRTVVYFKGCKLRCKWCHNPETLSAKKDILYHLSKCIGCGRCIAICPEHHTEDGYIREGCLKCGKCADECPTGALTLCGDDMSVEEVISEVKKDKHFYDQSGGGVTLSGGECLLSVDFVTELLKCCKKEGIHTAIESAFFVPFENVEAVLPYVDFFFADLKIPDPAKHKEYTSQTNELIIENIRKLSFLHNEITIRIPLIVGVNDSEEDMLEFAKIINTFGDGIKCVELLKYNYLAKSKYDAMDMQYNAYSDGTQQKDQLERLKMTLEDELLGKCRVIFD